MRMPSTRAPLRYLLSTLILCAGEMAASAERNFVSTFIAANGGCGEQAPLMNFDYGAGRTAPFGKPVEDWTDGDLKTLKDAMTACVQQPNGFDLSQEESILKKVTSAIEEGRQSRQARERQVAAARQLAQERAEAAIKEQRDRAQRREEAAARSELRSFGGHIMTEAERDRARQIKAKIPSLVDAVDNLLLGQVRLQRQAEEEQKRVAEREEAARGIKAEQAKTALQEKRAEQEAEIEAERKRDAFAAALPSSCKEAQRADKDLASDATRNDFARATAFAEAGDVKAACGSFVTYAAKLESVRAQLVQCTKDLDTNLDELAREEAGRSLDRASGIFASQKSLRQTMNQMACR